METKWIVLGVMSLLILLAIYVGMNMVRMEVTGTITILVNDPDGNPAVGAQVILKNGEEIMAKGTSGEDGIVVFTGVRLNVEYTVEAKLGDSFAVEKIFPMRDGDSFVINLMRGGEGAAGSDRPNL